MWNRFWEARPLHALARRCAWAAVLVAVCAALPGCETVEDRIARHQAFFDRLDPGTQATLRAGEVRLGYTPTMALIAFGRPDAVVHRTSAAGEELVWLYRYDYPVYDGTELVGYRFYEVHRHGARRIVRVPEFRERYRYVSEDYLRLTFSAGRITEIERIE